MANKLISKRFLGAASGLAILLAGCTDTPADKAEDLIDEICASEAPLLIFDNFAKEMPDYGTKQSQPSAIRLDINGDGLNDIGHGELVAKIARLSGKNVITYGIDSQNYRSLTQNLWDILDKIDSGEMEKPSAISLSMTIDIDLPALDRQLGESLHITPENIEENKEAIIEALLSPAEDSKIRDNPDYQDSLYMISVFHEFGKRGIPIITASGNEYSQTVNFISILGDISVGALTIDGRKADYSNNSSLTTVFRTGDIVGRRVEDGIDINNDDIADFADSLLSGEVSTASIFNGSSTRYKTSYDKSIFVEHRTPYGDYLLAGDLGNPYREEKGRLYFDPLDNGDPRQVSITFGTSFAAPNICGK